MKANTENIYAMPFEVSEDNRTPCKIGEPKVSFKISPFLRVLIYTIFTLSRARC